MPFPCRRRQVSVPLDLLYHALQALGQTLALQGVCCSTARPANAAVVVYDVGIADFAVQQADRLPDIVGDAASHQEVLVPILLSKLLPQRSHEHADEPGLARVGLDVDVDKLGEVAAAGDDVVERRVGLLGDEAGGLALGPLTAEDGDDAGLAREQRSCVAGFLVRLEERLAVQVGEEEGELGLEQSWRCDEGLALVELQVVPVAEVRSGHRGGPIEPC